MPATAMAEPVVRFDNVSVPDAVRGLDLAVGQGEFLTLLAPDGATSALLALAGFVRVTQGRILLEGRPLDRTPAHQRGLGVVLARPALLPYLTVVENVALPLRLRGVRRAERAARVVAMLGRLGLGDLAGLMPERLAPAQAARVALARALVFAPPLVVLDDPARHLDGAARVAWREDVRRVQRALGVAMLLATRDAAEALAVSDRVAVLDGGVLRQVGTPGELYEEPGNAFVAASVGETNVLVGRITAAAGGVAEIHLRAGPVVSARMVDELRVGDACLLSIRPERIALAAVEAARMGEDAVPAVVEEMTYQGDHARFRLIIGEDAVLIVKRHAAAGLSGLAANRPVALAWRAEHARVFRAG